MSLALSLCNYISTLYLLRVRESVIAMSDYKDWWEGPGNDFSSLTHADWAQIHKAIKIGNPIQEMERWLKDAEFAESLGNRRAAKYAREMAQAAELSWKQLKLQSSTKLTGAACVTE